MVQDAKNKQLQQNSQHIPKNNYFQQHLNHQSNNNQQHLQSNHHQGSQQPNLANMNEHSQDSDGGVHDNSSFQNGIHGQGYPDESHLGGVVEANQQNQFDSILQKHQDATLNRNHWVPDQKARQCFKCYKDFTFFYRKHHCRICGNVFCHNCTTVQAIKSNGMLQKNVRMCGGCVEMINKYQEELSNKNNLIFTHSRTSNYFSHDYNIKGLNEDFMGEFHEAKDHIQHAKDLEELNRIRQIKNEIDDIDNDLKRDGINRLLSALEEEKVEYTGSIQIDMQNTDKINYQRLRDFSNYHIQNMVLDIMRNNGIDQEKWGAKLLEFVSTAVESVKPSSRLLGDDMNFNHYIKIKIINYADNSKSVYINGVVLNKNLADKRMEHKKENPRILLLKDSLGSVNNDNNMFISDISTVIDQEQYQVNIIKEKLTQVKPDIIIVEKDVSFQVLEQLKQEHSGMCITVITNLNKQKMKRIARYTQTIISPSYNVIDKSFVLGKCKSFKAEKPYTANLIKNFNKPILEENNKNDKLISNERTLLYFEGCNPALGCTILLSGNIQTEILELRKVKHALQEMLKLARNIVLERSFLMDLNCQIPKALLEDGSINAAESPFLITRNISNRQTLVLSKVIMRKAAATEKTDKLGQQQNIQAPNPMQANANLSQQLTSQQIQTILQSECHPAEQASQMLSPHGVTNLQVPQMNPNYMMYQQSNEEKVKQSVDRVCGCPKKEKLTFYKKEKNDGQQALGDKTIGFFLRSFIKNSEKQCDFCKENMYKHFIQYYHKDGCIEVQFKLIQKNENKNKTQTIKPKQQKTQKKSETKMYGFCNLCNKIVTPEVALRDSFYEYSTARFLEQFFYNGDKLINLNRNQNCCNHRSLRDISRVFQFSKGVQITFRFIPLDVYTIEMIQPKTQDCSETLKQEIDRRKRNIEAGIHSGNEDLKTRISTIIEFIRAEKRMIMNKDHIQQQNTNIPIFIQPLKYIKLRLKELEKEISNIIQLITLPLHEVDSIFGTLFLERKILVNFLTFSKLLDEISRVACLLLVMLQLRVNILNKQQAQAQLLDNQFDTSQNAAYDNPADQSLSKGDRDHGIGSGGMGNQQTVDRNTQHAHLGSVERQTLSNLKQLKIPSNNQQFQQMKPPDCDLLISELFTLNAQDFNQTMNQNQTQMAIAPSKQIGTQNFNSALNIEPIKQLLKDKVQNKLDALNDEYISNIKQAKALDSIKSQQPLLQRQNTNSKQMEVQNWLDQLANGFVGLPLGTDNLYVPVKDKDIGSIISFVLASNIYKEAMIKQNYMDISQKIKGLRQHPRQQNQFPGGIATGGNTEVNPTPIGQRESNMNLQGFAQTAQYQTQNTYIGTHASEETIKLLGKNDVFNTELSAHQIETELLCGERLQFIVKFSTDRNDLSIKMIKNGNTAKLKQTSMQFTTGNQMSNKSKNKKINYNDYQDKVCPQLSKDYLDNSFFKDSVTELDKVLGLLNAYYFQQAQPHNSVQNQSLINATAQNLLSPPRTLVTAGSMIASQEDSQNLEILNNDQQHHFNHLIDQNHPSVPSMRESLNANFLNIKSPPMGSAMNLTLNMPQISTPQMGISHVMNHNAINQANSGNFTNMEPQEFCGFKSPIAALSINPNEAMRQELQVPKVDFQLKIYFPKKFEALRRFYCGSQYDFIQSLLKTTEWSNVSGGKSKSKFYKSYDDKYVYKELKKNEFKMFLEFASQYFDYLCKSFFHNYPCALCKILGAYKIKITSKQNGQTKTTKKYLFITENLNFGIKPEDESHIVRYDLKGSRLNRFVQSAEKTVLHDNNFLLQFNGRPLPIRYTINRILHICINNDTLCLSKSNIIDYSLLTIVDTKRKKVRFGIIDFVQQYTLEKIFESKFKNFVKGQEPTIVDPDKYKQRFKQAMKSYFVGMCIQEEKVAITPQMKSDHPERDLLNAGGTGVAGAEDGDMSDDDDDINETIQNIPNITTPAMSA